MYGHAGRPRIDDDEDRARDRLVGKAFTEMGEAGMELTVSERVRGRTMQCD